MICCLCISTTARLQVNFASYAWSVGWVKENSVDSAQRESGKADKYQTYSKHSLCALETYVHLEQLRETKTDGDNKTKHCVRM